MAFTIGGEIQALPPKIEGEPQEVTFEEGKYTRRIGKLVERVLADEDRDEGSVQTVFLLSLADNADTVRLARRTASRRYALDHSDAQFDALVEPCQDE